MSETLSARLPEGNVEVPSKVSLLWHHIKNRSFTASGYGRKIPTTRMVQLPGHPRWYRVYCIIFSNAGSTYIIRKGERIWVS